MCGIAGLVVGPQQRPQAEWVQRATAALAHRGPDDQGIEVLGQACLGHRRLGVIDLAGSRQPWISEDGRHALVFNGEIYNYLELRAELAGQGHRFRSQGDTEVLLAAYRQWGDRCLDRLNGMFAFAVWDSQDRRLFLARDRLGKKPLYYGELPTSLGGGIAFASELAALATFPGIADQVDPQSVADFLAYQCIPFERTIYRGARKLPPAHWLGWEAGEPLRLQRWWSPPFPETTGPSPGRARERLIELVDDATRLRLRADVPLGTFLSGGIDSAVVVGSLVRQRAQVESYTIGFEDTAHDERPAAAASARHFGTRHHEQVFRMDAGGILDRLLARFGEPFADASALPAWYLCAAARSSVTVALSGDGGDELFGGYRRYLAGRWVAGYLRWPAILRQIFEGLVRRIPEPQTYFGRSRLKQLKLFLEYAGRHAAAPRDCLPQTFSPAERQALLQPDIAFVGNDVAGRFGLERLGTVERMMLADLQAYLAEDVLTKVDRVSMDHALEVRSPLLDYRVVEFACRLPTHLKIRGTTQKWLLREAFAERLPAHVLRGSKQGFAVPLGALFRRELAAPFQDEVLAGPLEGWFQPAELRRLWHEHRSGFRDHGQKLWSLFVFARWHNHWMKRDRSRGRT